MTLDVPSARGRLVRRTDVATLAPHKLSETLNHGQVARSRLWGSFGGMAGAANGS
jgi:hypothetical protein